MKTTSLLYIGNKLSKHGFTKTTIETLGALFEKEGHQLYYASDKKNQLLRFLHMGFSVIQYRKKVQYVIIDTYSTSSFWYTFLVSQLCRTVQLKYIPILHGGNLPHRLDQNPTIAKLIFNNAYANVAPSGYLKHEFEQRGYSKIIFIPNTIEIEQYPFSGNREGEEQVPKLLWVRSFANLYNPKMAIDVLKELQQNYPQAQLCMVGPDKDGSLQATREYAQQQNVNVTFTGRLSKEEWIKLSQEYNVFINTTNFDNTPVSVIEAMCLGLPVVTTNVGGIPFLLQDQKTALLVQAGATTQMTQAITQLFQNPQLRKNLVQNAHQQAQTFDWKTVKQQWNTLLLCHPGRT
ncbi:glycosyltransferase [Flavobacterium sp.]|uniref:glycosyltransferase family 4 protein n=1 Tax=Flavobacterium sp. TaxID=239 RepID=UPI00261CD058|nr:glycosyltransferase [Flavobacterium sp.]MDD3004001.1 glycosyltransferase [Flavobacterium sp.]